MLSTLWEADEGTVIRQRLERSLPVIVGVSGAQRLDLSELRPVPPVRAVSPVVKRETPVDTFEPSGLGTRVEFAYGYGGVKRLALP